MKHVLSLIPFLLILLGIGFAAGAYLLEPSTPYSPLRYSAPQVIVGSKLLHPGAEFSVQRTKCNDGDEAVAVVLVSSDWRKVTDSGEGVGLPYRRGTTPLVINGHSCNERAGLNMLPLDIEPGTWQLVGLDCIVPEKRICQAWHTESFEILP